MDPSQYPFHAFAEWRVRLHSSTKPRRTVRFFRRSRNHSLIWNFVMQGHYAGEPRSVGECEELANWSRPTTHKLLGEAVAHGFFDIRPAPDDQRKRLIYPTAVTIAEYESMVAGYVEFLDTLVKR